MTYKTIICSNYILFSEKCTLQIVIDLQDGDAFQLIMLCHLIVQYELKYTVK